MRRKAALLCRKKPGFSLQFLSFTCGKASGISAAIPCAEDHPGARSFTDGFVTYPVLFRATP
jgi:hypothetical protein